MKTLFITSIIGTLMALSVWAKAKPEHVHESACTETQLEVYFAAQVALANDDFVAAQAAAKSLLEIAKEKGCSLDGKECCATELEAADAMANTTDIATARKAFKNWSNAVLSKVEESGVAAGPVYKMLCPMAFGNTGGTWLQNSSDLRNPYYGSMMLRCGMTQKEYASQPESQPSTQSNPHGAHHRSN